MTPPVGIGVIGTGNISMTYMRNAALFADVRLVACADVSPEAAAARAAEYGVRALGVDALLADPEVDLVLNLTVPSAHVAVTRAALSAGKHVFTEKPLATSAADGRRLVAEAEARGPLLGSAPDTFLGAAGRCARRLIDTGAIGTPVGGTAFMFGRGMEHWHPNPQFYYQPGGGPLFDMGPYYLTMLASLLGPVARVQAVATKGQAERRVTAAGPHQGTTFPVGTPTTILSLLEFASGALVSFGTSWDVFRHTPPPIELHGTGARCACRIPTPSAAPSRCRPAGRRGRTTRATAPSTVPRTGPSTRRTGRTTACSASPTWCGPGPRGGRCGPRARWRCMCSR